MFLAVTQPGRTAVWYTTMPQEGGLGASQLSLKCISASSLCNFERLNLGSVVSVCHSGNTNSATGSYFRCPGIIFQMPRHHISDAQASYFRCSSIQRRYAGTLAFTGTGTGANRWPNDLISTKGASHPIQSHPIPSTYIAVKMTSPLKI